MKRTLALVGVSLLGIVIIGLLGSVVLSFGTVGEDKVAVETQWGEATGNVYESGQFWMGNPLAFQGYSHSTDKLRVEPITMSMDVSEGLSEDGQDIDAQVSVTYQLDKDQAISFYTDSENSGAFTGGVDMWESRVGERAVSTAVQNAMSSISALELVQDFESENATNVELIRSELRDELEKQLNEENNELSPEIQIRQVRVEEVVLSDELDQGLEDIAVEEAEAERQIIDARADARAEKERAEGQADAFATLVEEYGSVDKALQSDWIEAINEDEGTIVLDAEAAPILDLNQNSTSVSTDTDN